METDQLHQTSIAIADLQESLDVFEGLFIGVKVAENFIGPFPEVGELISKALLTKIIIGTAAIFTDPSRSCGNENMSLKNLTEKYESVESQSASELREQLTDIIVNSNIKTYRNKFVGHYGLEEVLGLKDVKRHITINNLRNLYEISQKYLNTIGRDSGLLKENESMAHYAPIPPARSPKALSELIKKYA